MTDEERNSWGESLRSKLVLLSMGSGVLFGVITCLVSGPMASGGPKDPGVLHVLIWFIVSDFLVLFVWHNIWVRQLALPAGIVGAIYSFWNVGHPELYVRINLCGIVLITMFLIGLTEARATTGHSSDFWRSFLFHPLGWAPHFGIQTRVDRTQSSPQQQTP